MIKIFYILFAITMRGTVDQINHDSVAVELIAKDGHTHEEVLPRWIFPCAIEEGSVFWVDIMEKSITIRCELEKDRE